MFLLSQENPEESEKHVKINTNRVLSENDYVRFYLHSEFYPASRTSYMGYDLRYEVGADEFMV